ASRTGVTDRRFEPLANAEGANWSRRYYFRRALEHPGRVQVTRPYLSITGVNQCVTVSIATLHSGELRVLCADIAWRDHGVVRAYPPTARDGTRGDVLTPLIETIPSADSAVAAASRVGRL